MLTSWSDNMQYRQSHGLVIQVSHLLLYLKKIVALYFILLPITVFIFYLFIYFRSLPKPLGFGLTLSNCAFCCCAFSNICFSLSYLSWLRLVFLYSSSFSISQMKSFREFTSTCMFLCVISEPSLKLDPFSASITTLFIFLNSSVSSTSTSSSWPPAPSAVFFLLFRS